MALVKFHNGQALFMPPEKAAEIWLTMNGYRPYFDDKQRSFTRRIKKIYLNPEKAPKEYLEARREEDTKQKQLFPVRYPYVD